MDGEITQQRTSKEKFYTKREQRELQYYLTGETRKINGKKPKQKQQYLEKDGSREVGRRALCSYESIQTTHAPGVWPGLQCCPEQVVPALHDDANYNGTDQMAQNDGRATSITSSFFFYCSTEVLHLLKCHICFLFTTTISSLTDTVYSKEDVQTHTHAMDLGENSVLLLPFMAIWHSTICQMTRNLVPLFIVSQTPRAIPRITSTQTVKGISANAFQTATWGRASGTRRSLSKNEKHRF